MVTKPDKQWLGSKSRPVKVNRKQMLTLAEAGAMLGYRSKSTVYALVQSQQLKSDKFVYPTGGYCYLIAVSEVQRFLREYNKKKVGFPRGGARNTKKT